MIAPERNTASDGSGIEYISQPRNLVFADEWYQYGNEGHFWFEWRLAAFLRQIRDLGQTLDQKTFVLDIGCGTGVLGRQLEQATSWQVDGADLNNNALKHHVKGRGRIMYYDILDAQHPFLEYYDYVLVFDVLEHLPKPQSFLRAALKHLKVGGFLVVNVPAIQQFYSRYDLVAGHYRRYDEASLRQLFEGLLVDILDVRFWDMSMVPLLFLRKHLVDRLPSDKSVISRGFEPPNALFHGVLRLLMRLETGLIKRPWLGSSILLVARKASSQSTEWLQNW